MVQGDWKCLGSTGTWVLSLARNSGLRIWHLLQLWLRWQILLRSDPQPQGAPYSICLQAAEKKKKKKKEKLSTETWEGEEQDLLYTAF